MAAALLAVLVAHDGQPAPAHAQGTPSADATLSGLEVANATPGSDAPVVFNTFGSDFAESSAAVLREVTDITVTPTAAAGGAATITVQLESSGTPQTVASGTASSAIRIAPKADSAVPHNILVKVTAEDGVTTKTHKIEVYQFSPVSFGGATVSGKQFTAGTDVLHGYDLGDDLGHLQLPANTPDYYEVTYTATGLPAGLSMKDRIIVGTPADATNGAVTVTYTAEGEIGSSASLTFGVTVNPAVTFDAEALDFCSSASAVYSGDGWAGAGDDGTITFPAASGGTGTLTYSLTESGSGNPLAGVADGITFDAAARKLGGTPAQAARQQWSVRYRAEDERGSWVWCFTTVHAGGYGGL